ncbi:hypothetical protein Q31a_59060 [Aureliella helgolandensis]|uniref:Uncharacterized protein n=2 Tax=Aureliella helgolandensis TaxID=2527968 RepID=A0A518GG36_9BACT|nr:hypothetical protein Q31a_59060 [Aureliella helgolandensis]
MNEEPQPPTAPPLPSPATHPPVGTTSAHPEAPREPSTQLPDSPHAAGDLEKTSTPSRLPDAIDMEKSTVVEATHALLGVLGYSASLPERTLRSASALAGGFVRESANWLVPSAFRNSKSYTIFVKQMLDFVVNDVGGVRRALASGKEAPKQEQVDLARKTVGNLLDMTALATFHLSPLTVLAIFSDVAYGSKVYMRELSERLKEQGIISEQTTIDSASDLIEALEEVSGGAVGMFDQPPISITALKNTIEQTQKSVAKVDPTQILPFAEIEQLWRQMELAAKDQNASIWAVSATISVVALNKIQAVGHGTAVGLEIAGNMFQQHIIEHYWDGLRTIEREGLIASLSKSTEPYLDAIWTNFAIDRKTWTEQLLSGELLKWGWSQLSWPKLSTRG